MIPDYIAKMVRRAVPLGCPVVAGSTPVVAFGDARKASAATLGINPSLREFVDLGTGKLHSENQKRLETLPSLGASSCESLNDEQVEQVVEGCNSYFKNRPYMSWFGQLEKILKAGLQASYLDGSACHLDLSQWATDPVWGELTASKRAALIADGANHLREQLTREHIQTVVVNGRTVWDQVLENELCTIVKQAEISLGRAGHTRGTLLAGEGLGVQFLGWTCNIQSSRGITNENRSELASWLRTNSTTAR